MTNTIIFYGQFTKSGASVQPSSAPTIDVYQVTRSSGASSKIKAAQGTTYLDHGMYFYLLPTADLTLYDYPACFSTSDSTVDLKEVPALWVRWSEAVATDLNGNVSGAPIFR